MHRCVAERARLGPADRRRRPAAPRARAGAAARPRAARAGRGRGELDVRARASSRSRSRTTSSRRASRSAARSTASTSTRISARGIVVDYKSGAAPSATQIHDEARLQIPLYLLVLRDRLGLEPMGGVYMPLGGGRRAARDAARRRRAGAGVRAGDYLDGPEFEAEIEHARASAVVLAERIRAGDVAPRPARRRVPGLVRPLADVPQGAPVRPAAERPQQQAAIDARGSTFVSAGAGTGKTTVLVERFARAVIDDGLDVDSLLVITYTDRAAGELRARIRARLLELERPDLARDLDGAWISTIHGFCRRLLTAYPLAAGIDPRFRVLDESQARVLQGEAFNAALEAFCAADEPDRWQLLATYRRPACARCSSASTTRCARPGAS